MRISDWSSDVCSSDLDQALHGARSFGALTGEFRRHRACHRQELIERGHAVGEADFLCISSLEPGTQQENFLRPGGADQSRQSLVPAAPGYQTNMWLLFSDCPSA